MNAKNSIILGHDKNLFVKTFSKNIFVNSKINYCKGKWYYFLIAARKISSADTMEGALAAGALISSLRPLSSTAFAVVGPNAPITVPFCLKPGLWSNNDLRYSWTKAK